MSQEAFSLLSRQSGTAGLNGGMPHSAAVAPFLGVMLRASSLLSRCGGSEAASGDSGCAGAAVRLTAGDESAIFEFEGGKDTRRERAACWVAD